MKNLLIPILFLSISSCADIKKDKIESYEAGFIIIQTIDSSRIYKPDTDTTDYLHYRPLDIDIWYPSRVSDTDSVLLFGDILGLLEKRANYYTASDSWNDITPLIAQSFCEGFKCSDSTRLLNFKTRSYINAPAISKEFPLVIYLCSFNSMSFENFILFEELARKGFVVASISSIGRYPGNMTMKKEDLFEQVNDAIASLEAIKQSSNINFPEIGIVGCSWGGLSGAILADKFPDVSCLISLDGSEFLEYGNLKEEDEDLNDIRNSSEFQNMNLSMPYLRLESDPVNVTWNVDSVYSFSEKLAGERFIFKVDSAKHEDFSCLSTVVKESGNCGINKYFSTISKITVSFLQEHLKDEHTFSQTIESEIDRTISQK